MTKQDDKRYLKELADKVLSLIKKEGVSIPFIAEEKVTLSATNTGGWAAHLGTFRGYKCAVEIWFDEFTAYENRKIYYCVHSNKLDGIHEVATLSKAYLGEPILISFSDLSDREDTSQLKKPLTIEDFGKPIFEKYPEHKRYFYGVYEFKKIGLQRNEAQRLISRITEFIVTINDALLLKRLKKDAKSYKGSENRLSFQQYLQRERNRYLATLRKQHDNYVCEVCGFDYRKTYGQLGDDFAEAHHIVPLGMHNEQRITTINDLITVCANCHRMLDRMEGTPADIKKLKEIVRKRRAASSAK